MRHTEEDTPKLDPRNLALRRLNVREYSAAEMSSYLQRKGVGPAEAESVVKELVEEELINDDRYAKIVARAQVQRGKGSRYVLSKLRQKGVTKDLTEVREIIGEVSEFSELQSARRIVERRYPNAGADRAEAARAYQSLLRRGFSSEVARQAVLNRVPAEDRDLQSV